MSVFFEMHIRVGGDPSACNDFVALNEELAKLNHPACPDVDWARVEQWCQALFEHNGADLQTAAAFALARSHRRGLEGMLQGSALIDALSNQWSYLWPASPSLRLNILAWLFGQWQPLLRSLPLSSQDVPSLLQLDNSLLTLQRQLEGQIQMAVPPLQWLRQQLESLIPRLQHGTLVSERVAQSIRGPISTLPMPMPMPIVIWPANPPPRVTVTRRRRGLWLGVAAASVLAIGVALYGLAGDKLQRFATAFQQEDRPTPVHLDSLLLFAPGSSELRTDSAKVLIDALVTIKARPGWLIVISAHTDSSGDTERNLQLSHARALAVRDWMQRMGDIPSGCFVIQGVGAHQPVASNDTAAGRVENRRVDIRLIPEAGACSSASSMSPVASLDKGAATDG